MKTIKAYEFKDLDKDTQRAVQNIEMNNIITVHLEMLSMDLDNNNITEDQYYKTLGCTKYYAETTSWFIPSCYYDNNKKLVIKKMVENIKNYLYDKNGKVIGEK